MGALRQPRLSEHTESLRKPPQAETKPPSSLDKLRARTNYAKGEGWCAVPFAAFADLCKLSSGEVCWRFIGEVQTALASGSRSPKEAWVSWSDARTSQEWADGCSVNVRDIQRQISELQDRGMIGVKQIKAGGTVKYSVSLLYPKWGALEPYAVWKRRQVVAIDETPADETVDDEAPAAISKDAVVVSKPRRIAPGRASKAAKVSGGVTEFVIQNDSACAVDCSSVLQSGRLVAIIKANAQATGELKAKTQCSPEVTSGKGEDKGNVARHGCRGVPANEGSKIPSKEIAAVHPRAVELHRIFDPVLAHSGASLLSMDSSRKYSLEACRRVEDCDHDYLARFVGNRAKIKSVLAVPDICAEALASWKASKVLDGAGLPREDEGIRLSPKGKRVAESLRRIYGDRIK